MLTVEKGRLSIFLGNNHKYYFLHTVRYAAS